MGKGWNIAWVKGGTLHWVKDLGLARVESCIRSWVKGETLHWVKDLGLARVESCIRSWVKGGTLQANSSKK